MSKIRKLFCLTSIALFLSLSSGCATTGNRNYSSSQYSSGSNQASLTAEQTFVYSLEIITPCALILGGLLLC